MKNEGPFSRLAIRVDLVGAPNARPQGWAFR